MDIERIVVRFMADASQYNRILDGVDARLRNFARSASGLASFIVSPIAAATESVMALSRVIVDSGRYAVGSAMHYEQLGIQLEVIAKNADRGKQLLEDMFQVAVTTPFQVKDVAAAGKELAAFGFSVEEIVPLVKQLGDVSAGTGTPMHRLILAFGQAKIAGRLMGQEMRQFVNANVPMIEHLALVLGKPTAQIKKMIENGQVGFDAVQKAMNKMTGEGGIFGGMMERMNKTAIGQWRSFIESLEIGLYKVGQVFFEVFDLKDTFQSWKDWAMDTSKDATGLRSTFEGIRDVLHGIRDAARVAWEVIKRIYATGVDLVAAIAEWGDRNQSVIKTLVMIVSLTTAFRIAVWAVTAAWVAMRAVLLTIQAILGVNALLSALSGIGTVIAAILSPVGLAIAAIGGLIAALIQLSDVFKNFGDNFIVGFDIVAEDFKKAWTAIKEAIADGDFERAFQVAFKAIQIGWRTLLLSMQAEVLAFAARAADELKNTGLLALARSGLLAQEAQAAVGLNEKPDWSIIDKMKKNMEEETQAKLAAITDDFLRTDPRLNKLREDLKLMVATPSGVRVDASLPESLSQMIFGVKNRAANGGTFPWEQEETDRLRDQRARLRVLLNKDVAAAMGGGVFGPNFMDRALAANSKYDRIQGINARIREIESGPIKEVGALFQELRANVFGPLGGSVLGPLVGGQFGGGMSSFNTTGVHYAISGEAKSLAEKVQQQYMRGVGEETHKYDTFVKNAALLQEAQTGMTPEFRKMYESAGPITGSLLKMVAGKQSALGPEEADYGLLNEFDKLHKYVGDRQAVGGRPMLFGSADAQDTINRAVTQQVPVLEQIRTVMEAAKEMQRQQLEYQRQATDALKKIAGESPNVAPMPREAGFGADIP